IGSIYPKTEVQSCIVHQIRNTLKYVASKDSKAIMVDVKLIYRATSKELAEDHLDALEKKWGAKYPIVIKDKGSTDGFITRRSAVQVCSPIQNATFPPILAKLRFYFRYNLRIIN